MRTQIESELQLQIAFLPFITSNFSDFPINWHHVGPSSMRPLSKVVASHLHGRVKWH